MGQRRLRNETTIVDKSTGEVLTIAKDYTIQTSSEEFYMTFISNLASLWRINSVTDIKVIAFLCGAANFNTGHVTISSKKRKEMMEQLKLNNRQTITNSLGRLKRLGLIYGDDGEYDIDPRIFWKGSTQERDRLLKKGGPQITVNFSPKD
jgi:hypothetical protein